MSAEQPSPVLELKSVTISALDAKGKPQRELVQELRLAIYPGEIVGLVGESGSGKSVTASAILGLLPRNLTISSGCIELMGSRLCSLSERERRFIRGKRIAYVFQNYQGSFTPFMKIGRQLVEALRSHEPLTAKEAEARAKLWLDRVQLPADRIFRSYPFQLSGGQLQRASLAAALMMQPDLIIADEPTTALDVLTGEQVLELLVRLQQETGCAVLLISHDLAHVRQYSHRTAVMYSGQLLELGSTGQVLGQPQHPYTRLLMNSRPRLTGEVPRRLMTIPGEPGAAAAQGCAFRSRCPYAGADCAAAPGLREFRDNHASACHFMHMEKEVADESDTAASRDQQVVYA